MRKKWKLIIASVRKTQQLNEQWEKKWKLFLNLKWLQHANGFWAAVFPGSFCYQKSTPPPHKKLNAKVVFFSRPSPIIHWKTLTQNDWGRIITRKGGNLSIRSIEKFLNHTSVLSVLSNKSSVAKNLRNFSDVKIFLM